MHENGSEANVDTEIHDSIQARVEMKQRQRAGDPDNPWSYSVHRTEESYGEDGKPTSYEEKGHDGAYDRQTCGSSHTPIGRMLLRQIRRDGLQGWNLLSLPRLLSDRTFAIRRRLRRDEAQTARARENDDDDASVDDNEKDGRKGDDHHADVKHTHRESFVE